MNTCAQIRDELAALVYGELPPAAASAVRRHLEGCPECQAECDALRQVRGVLDAAPTPEARVDLPRLYADAASRQERQLRRWRRVGVAALAAAAVLLIVLGLRLEVRLEQHQLVVRWGTPPEAPAPRPQPPAAHPSAADVELAFNLVHGLAADVDGRDGRQRKAVLLLQQRLTALERQSQERWGGLQRDVGGLYALFTTQINTREKGEGP